jgi:phosphatidylinositol-3-phosphatase
MCSFSPFVTGLVGLLALVACNSYGLTPSAPASPLAIPTSPVIAPSALATLTPTAVAHSGPAASTATAAPSPPSPAPPAPQAATSLPQAGKTIGAQRRPDLTGIPSFDHIYVIVMENKEYGSIVGSSDAPFLQGLITRYGVATNYTGVAHPSEPNYFALFSGSTQGATGDGVYNLPGQNLADQIEAAGKTWRVFAENDSPNCFAGVVAVDGQDGSGVYARKHNPAISFTDISRSPARCANITDFSHFDPAAAAFELIVPNLCHDMHDCAVSAGDEFLKGFVPKILNSPPWQQGGVLFITWDEGVTNAGGGGRVPLLVISNQVDKGFRSKTAYNHYSLVRTVEDAWGLPCLNQSCQAANLADFFH